MARKATPPQANLTVSGRLSYPVFTYAEALERNNSKSKYPKKPEQVAPDYNLLLEQDGEDKVVNFLVNTFIPELREQIKTEQRLKDLTPDLIDELVEKLESGKWDSRAPFLPLRPLSDKSKELAPSAVSSLKISGNRQQDLELKAVVRDEGELLVPSNVQRDYPVVLPLKESVHELFPGCIAGTTLNAYGYMSGANPGIGLGGPKLVFQRSAERFGGGVALDEDALFED